MQRRTAGVTAYALSASTSVPHPGQQPSRRVPQCRQREGVPPGASPLQRAQITCHPCHGFAYFSLLSLLTLAVMVSALSISSIVVSGVMIRSCTRLTNNVDAKSLRVELVFERDQRDDSALALNEAFPECRYIKSTLREFDLPETAVEFRQQVLTA